MTTGEYTVTLRYFRSLSTGRAFYSSNQEVISRVFFGSIFAISLVTATLQQQRNLTLFLTYHSTDSLTDFL